MRSKAKELLASIKGKPLVQEERRLKAIELAGLLLHEALATQTICERKKQNEISRMIEDPMGKVFTTQFTDQCFRTKDDKRAANQLVYLLRKFGIPKFLTPFKRLSMVLFKLLANTLPSILIPIARHIIRQETAQVILPGEFKKLSKHLRKRMRENVRINLNHLGEAILGEKEAQKRFHAYLSDLANPEIEYISVKISTIYSQINLIGREHTLQILSERLQRLYRAAKQHRFKRDDGTSLAKFVNLDMEEYRDLHLTVDLFRRTLEDPEFFDLQAGIVLQSYLPDSFELQEKLTEWALRRVEAGGAPIKIRIVKGANLAMELVDAALHCWPQAPYTSKLQTDANFKRMVIYGCHPRNAKAVKLGIGSHNLFDIAYALLLRSENDVEKDVCFEMLEGMADPIRRVVQKASDDMLLYCPTARKDEFQFAVAYLVRRLDENTAPQNFLRHAFNMQPGSKAWNEQAALFSESCALIDKVNSKSRRDQDRRNEVYHPPERSLFSQEPDTDWSVPYNSEWAENIRIKWKESKTPLIPLVIGNKIIKEGNRERGADPSRPNFSFYEYISADLDQASLALQTAEATFKKWKTSTFETRSKILYEVAKHLRHHRGDLIGAMVADGGKIIMEADSEVSEAIDFVEYYRRSLEDLNSIQDITWSPKGVILVAPPWNFPCSIPAGCISAALATGNTVIFKPAPEAVLTGWHLAQAFWEGGIGKDVLQFFPCPDEPVGTRLIQDKRISAVMLTGSTHTALQFLKMRPGLDLIAETGGKNAIIITKMSDRDLAIKDLVNSAFGHAGQKCSACSLVICEGEVYDDPRFLETLRDAVSSMVVGSQWNPSTRINPLIGPPGPALARGLTTLDPGESWLLEPKQDKHNPNLWFPGIKLGVKPGSFTHQNELFGPVLSLMRAENLDEAIDLANGTPYGLTSGLHSLDEREHRYWLERIEAGNLYINRSITGAIVQRQPFGGCKASSFGRGLKAGGPNYLMQLMNAHQSELPSERSKANDGIHAIQKLMVKSGLFSNQMPLWSASVSSYAFYWNHYFLKSHDPSLLLGQDNYLMYAPYRQTTLRIQDNDHMFDVLRVIAAACTCSVPLEISGNASSLGMFASPEWVQMNSNMKFLVESEDLFCCRILNGEIHRIRSLNAPSIQVLNAASQAGCYINATPVMANGRIELLHYLREVSISSDYHRYGNLGTREKEKRRPLLSPIEAKKANKSHQNLNHFC